MFSFRPGASATAAALAVELAVSCLEHPLRGAAPAVSSSQEQQEGTECVLGLVPHTIRFQTKHTKKVFLIRFFFLLLNLFQKYSIHGSKKPVLKIFYTWLRKKILIIFMRIKHKLNLSFQLILIFNVQSCFRGSLHSFNQFLPTGSAFSQCTACSPTVLQLYKVIL